MGRGKTKAQKKAAAKAAKAAAGEAAAMGMGGGGGGEITEPADACLPTLLSPPSFGMELDLARGSNSAVLDAVIKKVADELHLGDGVALLTIDGLDAAEVRGGP